MMPKDTYGSAEHPVFHNGKYGSKYGLMGVGRHVQIADAPHNNVAFRICMSPFDRFFHYLAKQSS